MESIEWDMSSVMVGGVSVGFELACSELASVESLVWVSWAQYQLGTLLGSVQLVRVSWAQWKGKTKEVVSTIPYHRSTMLRAMK